MSINSIINSSLSGLFVNQQALHVTSNNIANVNTPGYNRLEVEQSANILQGEAAGVLLDGVTRVVDTFLESASRVANSNAMEYTSQREFHDRIQGVLGDPNASSSLSSRMSEIYSSLADLTLNPADVLRRQQTLNDMQAFFDSVSLVHDEIQGLRTEASEQIKEKVLEVNALLDRVYQLNPLIAKAKVDGNTPGALEGEMSQVLDELSALIDINVRQNDNGTYVVATSSGVTMVDTNTKSEMEYEAPGFVDAGTFFDTIKLYRLNPATDERISEGRDMNGQIRSGQLRGLMEIRDEQLVDLSSSLGEFSARFSDEMNAVHNTYSAVPAPNSLSGVQTFIDGSQSVNFTGQVTFAITDASNRLVNSHTVDFDTTTFADYDALIANVNAGLGGDGTLALTNGVMSLTATNSANGVVIADDETTPSRLAGRGFSHYFGMNDLVTSRRPGIYETGLTGTDPHTLATGGEMQFRVLDKYNAEITTVTVNVTGTSVDDMITELNNVAGLGGFVTFSLDSNGSLTWESNGLYEDIDLQLISDTTAMGDTQVAFTTAFGLDKKFQIEAAADLNVVDRLKTSPAQMAVSVFDSTAAVGDIVLTAGDQRGALAFQYTETELYTFEEAGELRQTQVSFQQYLGQFLGNAGLMASRAENLEVDNTALQSELFQRRTDVSGVNLDEELSNLIVYQNAYNASARILSTAQELYDTLLQSV